MLHYYFTTEHGHKSEPFDSYEAALSAAVKHVDLWIALGFPNSTATTSSCEGQVFETIQAKLPRTVFPDYWLGK